MSVVTLDEMIDALECGRKFYAEAAEKVNREDLKILFRELASFKRTMRDDLRSVSLGNSEPAADSSFVAKLESTYAEIKANCVADKDYRYLASLAVSEDQILHAFGNAMVNSDDFAIRDVVRKHLESLIQNHRRLLKLRHGQSNQY